MLSSGVPGGRGVIPELFLVVIFVYLRKIMGIHSSTEIK